MNTIEICGLLILFSGGTAFALTIPNFGYMAVAFIIIVIGIAVFVLGVRDGF